MGFEANKVLLGGIAWVITYLRIYQNQLQPTSLCLIHQIFTATKWILIAVYIFAREDFFLFFLTKNN